jgi:hypothetical protein
MGVRRARRKIDVAGGGTGRLVTQTGSLSDVQGLTDGRARKGDVEGWS